MKKRNMLCAIAMGLCMVTLWGCNQEDTKSKEEKVQKEEMKLVETNKEENEKDSIGHLDGEERASDMNELMEQITLCDYHYIPLEVYEDDLQDLTAMQNMMLDYLIENSTLPEIPEKYLDDYKEEMKTYYEFEAKISNMELGHYLKWYYNMTEEQFEEEMDASAEIYVKSELLLNAIAQKEEIKITETAYNEYVDFYAEQIGYTSTQLQELLEEENQIEGMKEQVLYSEVFSYLAKNVVNTAQESEENESVLLATPEYEAAIASSISYLNQRQTGYYEKYSQYGENSGYSQYQAEYYKVLYEEVMEDGEAYWNDHYAHEQNGKYEKLDEQYGEDWQLTYKVTGKEELAQDTIESYQGYWEDRVEIIGYELDDYKNNSEYNQDAVAKLEAVCKDWAAKLSDSKVEEGYQLNIRITIKGSKGSDSMTNAVVVLNIDGDWMILNGFNGINGFVN